MSEMTPMERFEAALRGEKPDRVPVMFMALMICAREINVGMREYAKDAEKLARGQLAFFEKYKPDVVTPGTNVCMTAEAFGTKTKFHEGLTLPVTEEYAVKTAEDWEKIEVPDPKRAGRRGVYLGAVEIISERLRGVPIMGFIISPLTLASWVADLSRVVVDMKKNPDLLHKGLRTLTDAVKARIETSIDAGVTHFMLVCTRASRELFKEEQYAEFGMPYDLEVLSHAVKRKVPIVAHVCGVEPLLSLIIRKYPIVGVNWWDRGTKFSLKDVKNEYEVTVIGGVDQNRTLLMGTPEDVEREAADAIKNAAPGGRFILSAGCELPAIAPPENIKAVVRAAEKYGKYVKG